MNKEEFVCAQDIREQELKTQGKTYFRIGRAIFVIEPIYDKDVLIKHDTKTDFQKMIQEICGLTGYLKVTVEGDPDSGIESRNEVVLTGYRFGLGDIVADGKLLHTTHGDTNRILKNIVERELDNEYFLAKFFDKDYKRARKIKQAQKLLLELSKQKSIEEHP
ncbi:MAG: hypothetical protein WC365_09085 [Candidatus Babeliales bacterium]